MFKNDSTEPDQDEQQGYDGGGSVEERLQQCEQKIDDLTARVAAIEAEEQGEDQQPAAPAPKGSKMPTGSSDPFFGG